MIIDFVSAFWNNPLLFTALLAGILASISSGIMGSYIVVKRIVFISGGIAHSVLGGMGFFLYLQRVHHISWAEPIYGALISAVLSAWLIGFVHIYYREREDSLIAAIWSVGMAVGIIFISLTPGYNVELSSFLLGNILWSGYQDLGLLGGLDLVIVLLTFIFHKKFQAICFDEDQAALQGIPVKRLYLLLLTLNALTVVLLIQIVGIILVITFLAIPPAIANLFSHRLSTMMLLSVFFSICFCLFGSFISYTLNWPLGATIAVLAGSAYLISLKFKKKLAH